ncbi:MAG: RcpC/CpaB family pilus assembly protein [Bacilli bacterium]|nr:RcpC/CpaB family pilus assembly protein [Bacilli bacterium]MDD3305000.1 RcpC/CpaB family pilus assembly protein [Bacilli bacterium]MDD4053880.1 RcpC/CpaB family pilus assembly protein [Bacilli bacterium]MDD4411030.1 RcpC/CpaB family pilus assembly protein [Bacilli bacterium]
MKNLIFNVKKFLTNKNSVTIIGVFLGILVLYVGYNYRVQQAIKPERIPYALTTIQPRQKITEDMVGYTNVPPAMIMGSVMQNANLIVGKYANYNTIIPEGSLFYSDTIIGASELPDSAFIDIPEGNVPFSLPVTVETTYGNSIFPGNYINIYFKALDEEGKVIVGKLVENIKVLAVKDTDGKHVFENTDEDRKSRFIIFAVPEELHLMLRKAFYLGQDQDIMAAIIPVPNTESYTTDVGAVTITNQYLKAFIEINTGFVPEDELPELNETTPPILDETTPPTE